MRKIALLFIAVSLLILAVIPAQAQEGTILDIAASNPDFSTLVAAVNAADPFVATALAGDGPLTVFAPTNDAFARFANFLGYDLERLLEDEQLVTDLLLYHVTQGSVFSGQAAALAGTTVPSLYSQGSIGISVADDGTLQLNRVADIIIPDIVATNGVIHAIDQVIFPNVLLDRLEGAAGDAFVRVGHFSADTRSVDVLVDGEVAISALSYGRLTDWVTLPVGTYQIAVVPTGGTINSALIGPVDWELTLGSRTTVAAVGSSEEGTLAPAVIPENRAPLSATNTRVTVLHAIPDAPAVDVLANGGVLISDISFPNFVTGDVAANTYDLAVVPSGESEPVVIDLPDTTLRSGRSYFVAAIGTLDDPRVVVDATPFSEIGTDEAAEAPPVVTPQGGDEMASEDMDSDSDEEMASDNETMGATIADLAMNNEDLSTLVTIVEAADPAVLETLSGEGPVTVFAPTNAAFDAVFEIIGFPADQVIALGGAELLTPVLLYHVIDGEVMAADVAGLDGESVETLLGEEISISVVGDTVFLNDDVEVIMTDIVASNGVVHVIDAVLLPQVTIETLAGLGVVLPGG